MSARKLTKTVIDGATPRERDYFIWDRDLKGFGLKVSKGGRKSYVCQYRTGGGRAGASRRMTIGAHGSPWTPDAARAEARAILGRVANGEDPALEKQEKKKEIRFSELCDLYLSEGCATKKASTIATDKGRIERHIKPLLGRKKVKEISRADVKRFLKNVAEGKTATDVKTRKRGRAIVTGGKGTASRTVGLLGGIFSYAIDCGLVDVNPVRGVKRFPDRKGDRYLSQSELVTLGEALRDAELKGVNPSAIAILKLLIFTGARKGEIESLKWSYVDIETGHLRLPDSKTGQKVIPLNAGSMQILSKLDHLEGSDFVFPASRGDGHYLGIPKAWRRIRKSAGLENVRLHDLRHSFASIAVSGGASLPIIGALLGHADAAITHRYAHLNADPLKAVSETVGERIAAAMGSTRNTDIVVPLNPKRGK